MLELQEFLMSWGLDLTAIGSVLGIGLLSLKKATSMINVFKKEEEENKVSYENKIKSLLNDNKKVLEDYSDIKQTFTEVSGLIKSIKLNDLSINEVKNTLKELKDMVKEVKELATPMVEEVIEEVIEEIIPEPIIEEPIIVNKKFKGKKVNDSPNEEIST